MESKEAEAKKMATEIMKSFTPEDYSAIKANIIAEYGKIAEKHREVLDELLSKQTELTAKVAAIWEIEKNNQDYSLKSEYMAQRADINKQLKEIEYNILNEKNVVAAILNGGDLISFTDKKGLDHKEIPDFRNVDSTLISFDEETILTDPLPPYIPIMDEAFFARRGYVFDAIRLDKDQYLLATIGFSEKVPENFKFAYVTLDQLVLINQYYLTKAKAILQKEADERTGRSEKYYDALPAEKRERHFNQKGYYRSLPSNVKKKITQEAWEALDLEGKEKLYKPFKKYGTKRLTSKLEDNEMWISFHEMYERFKNPRALPHKKDGTLIEQGEDRFGIYGSPEVFEYWYWFRDMMKWKIKDLAIQREVNSEMRKLALETSFGESNTNDTLRPEYGILVKRQNGSEIKPDEIEHIRTAWALVLSRIGNVKHVSDSDALKISHTGDKYVFASKASGMFVPSMKTIAVTNKYGEVAFSNILAHEVGHYIDFKLGERSHRRYITDDFENSAGIIASTFRKNMNAKSESDYVNATKECFARALEQYFAIETYGPDVTLLYNATPSAAHRKYILEDSYVSLESYNQKLKPLINAFLLEQSDFFGEQVITPAVVLINETKAVDVTVEIPELGISVNALDITPEPVQVPKTETIPEPTKMDKNQNTHLEAHQADIESLHNGTLSLEAYKAAFKRLIDNKEEILLFLSKMTKEQLLKPLSSMQKYRYKNEPKAAIIKAVWNSLLDDFVHDTVQYGFGSSLEKAIAIKVEKADQAYLADYASVVKDQREQSAKRRAALQKAFENPETIEEFRDFIDYKGKESIKTLPIEKQELYDELISGKTKEVRAKEAERKAVVKSVDLGNTEMNLVETKHTQKGHDLFVVQLTNRVEKDTYNDLNIKAKRLGGYYSSFNKGGAIAGFQFKEKDQALKFMSLTDGDVNNLDAVQERQEEQKQDTAEKLAEIAAKTIETADEKLNQNRLTNTSRRAAMATNAEENALKDKQLGETLQNIASAISSGEAKHLDGIKTKSHVELLDKLVNTAKREELREKYPNYQDYLNHKGEAPTSETVMFLKQGVFPKIYKDSIQSLINEVKNKSGMKLVSARWQKHIEANKAADYLIPVTDKAMMELADMSNAAGLKSYNIIKSQVDDYKRLKAMGIENDSMLRASLREFIKYRGGLGKIDQSKLLERQAIGKKLGIDFFPTPKDVAVRMAIQADLHKGMTALEPSAGNGNIAEIIRTFGVEPDVIEISEELTKILEAKGFNVIGHDFLQTDFTGKKYDRIIMNPPFSNSQDIKHVSFAYDLLNPGGRVVAIMGEGAFIRNDKTAVEFREWLDEIGGYNEPLPANTFKDSSLMNTTGANARMVILINREAKTEEKPEAMETEVQSPSSDQETKPTNEPTLFAQTGNVVINSSIVNNWSEVPSVWKNTGTIKEVKYINSPYDKGLINIVKSFLGDDSLRPVMSGINFDSNGITATNAHVLITLPYPNPKYNGIYNTGPNASKIENFPGNKSEIKGDLFTGNYPNYQQVIPKADSEFIYECDVYKLLQYAKVAQKYCNKASWQAAFKYKDSLIGFNTKFLIDVLETALKLGHGKLYVFINQNNKAVIFTPDQDYLVGKSEIFLLMPVILSGDYNQSTLLGSHDLDFERHLNAYYDFTDNQIHNSDGSIAEFKMNYGEYSLLTQEQAKALGAFRKSAEKNLVVILENFLVKDKTIIAANFYQDIVIKNIDLSDGLYQIIDGAAEFNAFADPDEYPGLPEEEKEVLFSMPADALNYYLDKALEYTGNDDLRPHLNTYFFDHVDGKTFLVATNTNIFFKADISQHVKVLKEGNFSLMLKKEMLSYFIDVLTNQTVTISKGEKNVYLESSEADFVTKVESGKYPNYNSVIPSLNTKELILNVKDLYTCIKGPEAVAFLKVKKDKWAVPMIYDKPGENGMLDIYLGVFDATYNGSEKKILREVKICQVPYTYSEKETQPGSSLLLLMPIMVPNPNYFWFGYSVFKEILDTISSEDLILNFSEKNRAYVIPGESFLYKQTVSEITASTTASEDYFDDTYWKDMPESAAQTQAEYWGNLKRAWNKREITLSKKQLAELNTTQIYIDKYFPQFNHYLNAQHAAPEHSNFKVGEIVYYIDQLKKHHLNGLKFKITASAGWGNYTIEDMVTGILWGANGKNLSYTDGFTEAIDVTEEKTDLSVSEIEEINFAIITIEEILSDLEGDDKSEAKEALEILKSMLPSAQEEIKTGIKVEKEHAKTLKKVKSGKLSVKEAIKETAETHINEDPQYYDKLKTIE